MKVVKKKKMSEEKKTKEKGTRSRKKKEEIKDAAGLGGLPAVRVREEIAKMTVEDAVRKEGVLPYNPIDVVDDETLDKLGQHAGAVYGASLFTVIKAISREDLPMDKRVRRAMRGVRPLLNMVMEGASAYSRLNTLEDALLYGEEEVNVRDLLERDLTAGLKARRAQRVKETVSPAEVLSEIMIRLGKIEEKIGAQKEPGSKEKTQPEK